MYISVFSLFATAAALTSSPYSYPYQKIILPHRETDREAASPLTDEFDRLVYKALRHFHVPGLSIAIVDGNNTFAKGYGFSTLPNVEATPETLYYAASTTKSFTAAAFSLLIDESVNHSTKLSWKTPVSSIIRDDFVLPDQYITEHASFEDLASHRTGMPRHDASYGGAGFTLKDAVRNLRNLPLTAEFRATHQYCNMMFMVISYVIETLTGIPLGDFMRKRIWAPLSMDHTYFSPSDVFRHEDKALLAHGYSWDNDAAEYQTEPWMDDPIVSGAGNIISSVIDYSKYLRAMIYKTAPMSPVWYDEIRMPRSVVTAESGILTGPTLYSLGWMYLNYRGEEIYAHDGAVSGFGSLMAFLPNRNWGVVVFGNADSAGFITNGLCLHLMDELLHTPKADRPDWIAGSDEGLKNEEEELKNSRSRLYPSEPNKQIPLSLPLESYCGTYHNAGYRNITIELKAPSDRLPMKSKSTWVLFTLYSRSDIEGLYFEHSSGEYFVAWIVENDRVNGTASDATRAEFVIGPDGRPARLGIEFEPEMNGEKIWFDRIGS